MLDIVRKNRLIFTYSQNLTELKVETAAAWETSAPASAGSTTGEKHLENLIWIDI